MLINNIQNNFLKNAYREKYQRPCRERWWTYLKMFEKRRKRKKASRINSLSFIVNHEKFYWVSANQMVRSEK